MRVALAAEGTRGDVYPMLALGESLLAEGHQVVLCAPPDFRQAAEERGIEHRAVGIGVRDYLTAHADALAGGNWAALRAGNRYFAETVQAQFRELPEAAGDADWIFGAGVQAAAASVAELRGIPYRYIIYCPSLLPSADHAPALLPTQSMPRWANRLAWGLAGVSINRLLGRPINRERAARGLAAARDAYRHVISARPVLAADEELGPAPRDCPFEVEQIPCLHPLGGPALPPKLEAFLDQGEPPVYLGFGSMTDPDPAATTRQLVQALGGLGRRAIIAEGWAGLGAGPLPEGVLAIGPVCHDRLFPRLAAAVHHGGAGTTTTAARAGIPQIIVPHLMDQFYWAKRVSALGLGPPALPRTRLDASRLTEVLAATLDNELVAERARALGERLRARKRADTATRRLAELVEVGAQS